MPVKRIFKGPWLWIVLSAFAVLLAIQFLAPSDGYDEIETSTMSQYIAKHVRYADLESDEWVKRKLGTSGGASAKAKAKISTHDTAKNSVVATISSHFESTRR